MRSRTPTDRTQAVQRIQADSPADAALEEYESSGRLRIPLVGMQTSGDEIVLFFHLERYAQKAAAAGNPDLYHSIPIKRYGHCTFTNQEVLDAFQQLASMADHMAEKPLVKNTDPPPAATLPPVWINPTDPPIESEPAAPRGLWAQVVQFLRALVQ